MKYSAEIKKLKKEIKKEEDLLESVSEIPTENRDQEFNRLFKKLQTSIEGKKAQLTMMEETLKTMKSFGADDIQIGK